mgnify:FL=1
MPTAPAMQAAGPDAQEQDSANGPELAGWYLTHARGTSGVATAFLPASDLDRSSSHLDSVIPAHHAPYAWCGYGTRSEKKMTPLLWSEDTDLVHCNIYTHAWVVSRVRHVI